jgi:hypothetical protein
VYRTTQELRHRDPGVRADVRHAVRFSVGVAVGAVAFLVFAALWVSTCGGATADTVACGTAQRTLLALGAPAILLVGGVWAFVRTYQVWRQGGTWWPWQGAGWFLLIAMLLMLTMSLPPIAGSGPGG